MNRPGMMLVALVFSLCAFAASAGGDAGGWLTDFEQAKRTAAETKLPILADFSGSDWCGWCIKLEKDVFSQAAFKAYAASNLVLLSVDYPRKKEQPAELKKQNDALNTAYAIHGAFPTVLLLDATGKELARTGYREGGAKAYVKHLQELLKAPAPAEPK